MRRTFYILAALLGFGIAGLWFWERTRPQYILDNPSGDGTFWRYCEPEPNVYAQCTSTTPHYPWWVHTLVIGIFVIFAITLAVMACSSNIYRIKSGEVIQKKWFSSYTQSGVALGLAMGTAPMPDRHYPAEYWLKLRRGDGKTGWVCVTRDYYNKMKVGDFADVY